MVQFAGEALELFWESDGLVCSASRALADGWTPSRSSTVRGSYFAFHWPPRCKLPRLFLVFSLPICWSQPSRNERNVGDGH
jgi:hypothetical protein